ncbi:MAG: cytochrome c [Candidatus Eremiobacteraeota bacterium]|nr:cytochrome c [Candidatus Eremiobacteraeota bacterium]
MNRYLPLLLASALGLSTFVGCTKASTTETNTTTVNPAATGPVTDVGSSGLKPTGTEAPVGAGDAGAGKSVFTRNCASCHGAVGTEGGIGPSLKNEKSRKNTAAAIAWIKNPQPPMPKLYPSPLNEKDVADVAAYVESL